VSFNQSSVDLAGRVVIVTGAAGGIGRSICRVFSEAGAHVAMCDRDPAVEEFPSSLGSGHSSFIGDITDEAAIVTHVARVIEEYGRVDILVNNAGTGSQDPAELKSAADFDLTMAVNLRAPFLYSREVGKQMLKQKSGRVVNIASQAAVIGIEGHVAYSASKAGLIGMTNCLAVEWGSHGITANCVSPTIVLTEMGASGWAGEKGARALERIPSHRFATPEDVAAGVLFLSSDAAAMINGANLMIDGGYTIR
jgi:NAD(P)-dependent dehydrogenase (short-subunit alcohol dehydrogenase family)